MPGQCTTSCVIVSPMSTGFDPPLDLSWIKIHVNWLMICLLRFTIHSQYFLEKKHHFYYQRKINEFVKQVFFPLFFFNKSLCSRTKIHIVF